MFQMPFQFLGVEQEWETKFLLYSFCGKIDDKQTSKDKG